MYVLYGLMFLVGISIGSDRKAWAALKGQQLRIVLVPLATIVGTLAGSIGAVSYTHLDVYKRQYIYYDIFDYFTPFIYDFDRNI